MAAIEDKTQAAIAAALLVGICLFSGCSVELSDKTPGAKASLANCATTGGAASFESILNNVLQATGTFPSGRSQCGSCHNSGGIGSGSFTVFPGDTAANPSLVGKNACYVIGFGKRVAEHPQQFGHGGGAFPASDIQTLIDWVNLYVP